MGCSHLAEHIFVVYRYSQFFADKNHFIYQKLLSKKGQFIQDCDLVIFDRKKQLGSHLLTPSIIIF